MPLPPEPQTYTVAEVPGPLRMHVQSVNAAAGRGELPAFRVGRRWIFPREAIDAMLRTGHRSNPE